MLAHDSRVVYYDNAYTLVKLQCLDALMMFTSSKLFIETMQTLAMENFIKVLHLVSVLD